MQSSMLSAACVLCNAIAVPALLCMLLFLRMNDQVDAVALCFFIPLDLDAVIKKLKKVPIEDCDIR